MIWLPYEWQIYSVDKVGSFWVRPQEFCFQSGLWQALGLKVVNKSKQNTKCASFNIYGGASANPLFHTAYFHSLKHD